jgi:poly(A) polymerase
MIEVIRLAQLQKPQGRTRVRRPDTSAPRDPRFDTEGEPAAEMPGDAPEFSTEGGDAPAKKRRRRRKPVNRDNSSSANDGNNGNSESGSSSDGLSSV